MQAGRSAIIALADTIEARIRSFTEPLTPKRIDSEIEGVIEWVAPRHGCLTRQYAKRTQVIVANHDLLLADLDRLLQPSQLSQAGGHFEMGNHVQENVIRRFA